MICAESGTYPIDIVRFTKSYWRLSEDLKIKQHNDPQGLGLSGFYRVEGV